MFLILSNAKVPPRVEYEISEFGQTMRPMLDAMADWGNTVRDFSEQKSAAALSKHKLRRF